MIWKYESPRPGQTVSHALPVGGRVVSVDPSNGNVYCDVEDTEPQTSKLEIRGVGTGHYSPYDMTYSGLWLDGQYRWHVYTRITR